jgi:hypothetical protein
MKRTEKDKKQIDRKFKIMELNRTPERKQFEEDYSCYILSLRPDGILTPEDDKPLKWRIDTWYKVEKAKYDEVAQTYEMIKMRARFNNAHVYGVWLPKDFNTVGSDKIDNPDLFYDLIMKYKFKM